MRVVLILVERFGNGKIDALPIIEDYKDFKATDKTKKIDRLLKYRIDGTEAYKINKKNKKSLKINN